MELSEFDAWNAQEIAEHDAALDRPRSPWWARAVTAVGAVLAIAAATVIAFDPMGAI